MDEDEWQAVASSEHVSSEHIKGEGRESFLKDQVGLKSWCFSGL